MKKLIVICFMLLPTVLYAGHRSTSQTLKRLNRPRPRLTHYNKDTRPLKYNNNKLAISYNRHYRTKRRTPEYSILRPFHSRCK